MIDKEKILSYRKRTIETQMDVVSEAYNFLQENNTPVNNIKFLQVFKEQSSDYISNHLSYLYGLEGLGTSYLNTVLGSGLLSEGQLLQEHASITEYINKTKAPVLNESLAVIESQLNEIDRKDHLLYENLFEIYNRKVKRDCLFESNLAGEMDIIIYNFNYNPESIEDLEKIVREIKLRKDSKYLSSFVEIIDKNTTLILNIEENIQGSVLRLVTELPVLIANKIVELQVDKRKISSYIKAYEISINKMYKESTQGDRRKYILYRTYREQLNTAKDILEDYAGPVKNKSLFENIAELQPDIIPFDDSFIDDITDEFDELMVSMCFGDNDDITPELEAVARIERFVNRYCVVVEADGVTKVAMDAERTNRKIVSKLSGAAASGNRQKIAVKKAITPFVKMFEDSINKMKSLDKKERRERIMSGEFKLKLKKAIGQVAGAGGAGFAIGTAINPLGGIIAAAITLMVGVALDKHADEKERKAIIAELESELEIVNEKIDDSKGDGDRQKKYELMRIKQKLVNSLNDVKLRIK